MTDIRHYKLTIVGKTKIFLHQDNVLWRDKMKKWLSDPHNKEISVPGDDRSPAWTWLGRFYHDNERWCLPADMLRGCFMSGGAMMRTGKGPKTYKAQTQSGCMLDEPFWPLLVGDDAHEIPLQPFADLGSELDFDKHLEVCAKHGIELDARPASVNRSKHIRVRPVLHKWRASGTLSVWDPMLTEQVLQSIWSFAGHYKGIGDWRPGVKTPGPHGMFSATVVPIA